MGLPLPLPPGSTKRVANKGNRTKAEERDKGKGTVSGRAWPALLSSLISSPAEGLRQPRSLARLRGVGARGCFHSQAFSAPFRSSFIWVAQVWRHHRLLDRIVLVFSTRYGPIAAWPERSWKNWLATLSFRRSFRIPPPWAGGIFVRPLRAVGSSPPCSVFWPRPPFLSNGQGWPPGGSPCPTCPHPSSRPSPTWRTYLLFHCLQPLCVPGYIV